MKTVTMPMEQVAELIRLQLSHDGVANLTVTGSSMMPMLHNRRDTVVLSKLAGAPRRGDVILYQRENGSYILHRVIKPVQGEICICCGDNQWGQEIVPMDRIVAVVTGFRRNGKKYDVTHRGYRAYVRLWVGLFPVRKPMILARRLLGCLRHRLLKRK